MRSFVRRISFQILEVKGLNIYTYTILNEVHVLVMYNFKQSCTGPVFGWLGVLHESVILYNVHVYSHISITSHY